MHTESLVKYDEYEAASSRLNNPTPLCLQDFQNPTIHYRQPSIHLVEILARQGPASARASPTLRRALAGP